MENFVARYEEILMRKINEITRNQCEGCETNQGNQEAHDCVMLDPEERVYRYFHEAFGELDRQTLVGHIKIALEERLFASLTSPEIARVLVRPEAEEPVNRQGDEADENGVSSTNTL